MFKCPHCNEPAVSWLRKMFLGPALPATCRSCGKKVGVPHTAMIAVIPFGIAIVAARSIEPLAVKALLWIAGFLVMSVVHMLCIPLEPR